MSDDIRLGSAHARSGEKVWGQLRVCHKDKTTKLGVMAIHGKRPGKHLVLIANQHGNEVNGVEAIRRFCEEVDPRRLRGTIFAIPSANPHAALRGAIGWSENNAQPAAPYDSPYNMNWIWPGRTDGLLVERVAHEIWTRAILAPHARAAFVMDIHSIEFQAVNVVFAEDDSALLLGLATGLRQIVRTRNLEVMRRKGPGKIHCLSYACDQLGIPCLVVELGGQAAIFPSSVEIGRRAVQNVLRFSGGLPGRPALAEQAVVLDPWRDHVLKQKPQHSWFPGRATRRGLCVPHKEAYEIVKKGELVAEIIDPHTGRVIQRVRSPINGAIYGLPTKACCARGEPTVQIGAAQIIRPAHYLRTAPPPFRTQPGHGKTDEPS